MKVAGFGDNTIDRFLDRGLDYPGGNALNVAVFARRAGAQATYLGVFGSDDNGRYIRSTIERLGVRTDRCIVRPGPSGVSVVDVQDGDRVFRDWNGGGVTITAPFVLEREDVEHLAGFDLVHSSVYSASEGELPKLRGSSCLVSYDFSSEPEFTERGYLERVCPWVDVALVSGGDQSQPETVALLGAVVGAGAQLAVATRGADGALVFDGVEVHSVEAVRVPPERVVDTMGCGDAFFAAFAVGLLGVGWTKSRTPSASSVQAALADGARAAAQQCLVEGAFGQGRPVPEDGRAGTMGP